MAGSKLKATELELFGIFEWAKVFEFNRDKAEWNADTDGECKITIILDEENAKKFQASGSQKKMVADEDGRGMKVTVGRKFRPALEWQGGPPPVVDAAGNAWDVEENGLIGNGSKGVVYITVYETRGGRKGTRLEGVQVIEHVALDNEGGGSAPRGPRFKDYSSSAKTTPAAKVSSPPPSPKAAAQVDEDSIPF